jgi:uncharacterized protein (DUF885 family)
MQMSAKGAREGGSLVESIATDGQHPWQVGRRARTIAAQGAPAIERQIAELQVERGAAAAMRECGRVRTAKFYRWALKAATTTEMSPDEVHALGQSSWNGCTPKWTRS